jgi:DNA-binding LytR/AlgR family response regulator
MKIRAAIIDDESVQREYLLSLLKKWAEMTYNDFSMHQFDSAEAFIFEYEEDRRYDMLFIDIQMKGMNGIDMAKKIRTLDETVNIVFITAYPDFMQSGYDVNALHYLIKPVDEKKLFDVLDKALVKMSENIEPVIIRTKENVLMKIDADSIIYIEAVAHDTKIRTSNGDIDAKESITDMSLKLDEGFFRCQRSFIVSLKYIKYITRKEIVLDDGQSIPISRNLYDKANRAFISYFKGGIDE